jgi:hypothetical protein
MRLFLRFCFALTNGILVLTLSRIFPIANYGLYGTLIFEFFVENDFDFFIRFCSEPPGPAYAYSGSSGSVTPRLRSQPSHKATAGKRE